MPSAITDVTITSDENLQRGNEMNFFPSYRGFHVNLHTVINIKHV